MQVEPARDSIGGVLYCVALLAEPGFQVVGDVRFVLDDQDRCVHTYILGPVISLRCTHGC